MFAAGSRFDRACATAASVPGELRSVRLFVVQGSQRISVAQVAIAGADNSFAVSFGMPERLAAGSASLVAQTSLAPDEVPLATASFAVA